MKLILDFDDVLFNAAGLKEKIFTTLRSQGIINASELYETERNSGIPFSLKRFLYKVYERNPGVRTTTDTVYEEIMAECKNLVNQEIVTFVQSVGKENCYIVTNGDTEFQEDKIARTRLGAYVASVTVVPGSKKEAIEALCKEFVNEQVVFVDDKSKFFEDLGELPNLTTVEYLGDGALKMLQQKVQEAQSLEIKKPEENVVEIRQGMTPRMS